MRNSDDSTNQRVVFSDDQLSLEVRVSPKDDTVWLTQAQISELFEKTPQNITMHIRNIYDDEELNRKSTCKDFLQVQKEGGRDRSASIFRNVCKATQSSRLRYSLAPLRF